MTRTYLNFNLELHSQNSCSSREPFSLSCPCQLYVKEDQLVPISLPPNSPEYFPFQINPNSHVTFVFWPITLAPNLSGPELSISGTISLKLLSVNSNLFFWTPLSDPLSVREYILHPEFIHVTEVAHPKDHSTVSHLHHLQCLHIFPVLCPKIPFATKPIFSIKLYYDPLALVPHASTHKARIMCAFFTALTLPMIYTYVHPDLFAPVTLLEFGPLHCFSSFYFSALHFIWCISIHTTKLSKAF